MATTTIATEPRAGQTIEHDGKTYTTIREGRAFILVPPNTRTSVDPQAKSKAGEHVLHTKFVDDGPTLAVHYSLAIRSLS